MVIIKETKDLQETQDIQEPNNLQDIKEFQEIKAIQENDITQDIEVDNEIKNIQEFKEFWIINKGGIPLFWFSPEEKLYSNLKSGFFYAIHLFMEELMKSNKETDIISTQSISLGNSNYIFLYNQYYELYFIARSPKNVKFKRINFHLKNIEKIFVENYKRELNHFNGKISEFKTFLKIFKEYFENKYTQLKGMW